MNQDKLIKYIAKQYEKDNGYVNSMHDIEDITKYILDMYFYLVELKEDIDTVRLF